MLALLEQGPHNLLHVELREVGVGLAATDKHDGGRRDVHHRQCGPDL